jgi:isopenicillin N synthase-like dioxygenase
MKQGNKTKNNKMNPHGEVNKEEEIPIYASSLPVPNVQELVRQNPENIPERYIRDEYEMMKSSEKTHSSYEIPIIDLSLLSKSNVDELNKLDMACKNWGFFQVINHGVANEVLDKMKTSTGEFFDLPIEEKNKYSTPANDIQGYGHSYVVSEEQKLDWTDSLVLVTFPYKFHRLQFWPNRPNDYKETIQTYSNAVRKVGLELIESISLSLGMDKDTLFEQHKELMQVIRINYYPACLEPDNVMGLSPHSDPGVITILVQKDDDVNGLQVRHDGQWVPVQPLPNALIINVGNMIEILSNGKYKSVEHRAVVDKSKSRISFAMFFAPHDDVEIEPLKELIDFNSLNRVYKKVKYGEYLRESMKKKLLGKALTQIGKNII